MKNVNKNNKPAIGKAYAKLCRVADFATETEGTWISWAKDENVSDDTMIEKLKELKELGFVAFYKNGRIGVKASELGHAQYPLKKVSLMPYLCNRPITGGV